MFRIEWHISPAALLVFALLYFFDGSGLWGAIVPAVLVHELGHLFAMRLAGISLRRVSLGLFGLEMDYSGALYGLGGAAALAAGPICGLIFALAAMLQSREYWRMSGAASLVLSLFNLLPVLPLDGGRLLTLALGERGKRPSRGLSIALTAGGLWLWLSRGWFSLFVMGLWLAWCNFRGTPRVQWPHQAV